MSILQQLSSEVGDKTEKSNERVAKMCIQSPSLLPEVVEGLTSKKAALIGDSAEVLTKIAEENPSLIVPYVDSLTNLLVHKSKRVRWEVMHAIALITPLIPKRIYPLISLLDELIENDTSTIVRDYAIETVANLSKASREYALSCFPLLKKTMHVWGGKHRGRALKGMYHTMLTAPDCIVEIRGIAEEYVHDNRGVVKKAAKDLVKAIDKELI